MKRKNELYNLMEYLTFRTDDYAIGAHLYGSLDVNGKIRDFKNLTGKAPAFLDFDMHALPYLPIESMKQAVLQLKEFVNEGGFVTITDHWLTPKINISKATVRGANNSRDVLTRDEFYEVMTNGLLLNQNFINELKVKAEFLKMLQAIDIPVIYRPLHEGNANWFWWGINEDKNITGDDVAELYRYVYHYFAETYSLDNILWEFNTSINGFWDVLCDWYPGDKYVDMLSIDWYLPENDYNYFYHEMTQKCGKKPFGISEFGGDGNYDTKKYPLTATLAKAGAFLDMGAKTAYIGLYFDMISEQDCSLPSCAITLDKMNNCWAKSKNS